MSAARPDIGPAGYHGPLMVGWELRERRALVVGGGRVSTRRVRALLLAGADVRVVAPRLSAEIRGRVGRDEAEAELRPWRVSDLDEADLVLVAIDDPTVSRLIAAASRARSIPVHVADDPTHCDFVFPAIQRDGPIQVAVSTGGSGPALAGRLRDLFAAAMPSFAGEATRRFGELRQAVRASDPSRAGSPRRMRWLTGFARESAWADLAAMSDTEIGRLVRRYVAEVAPQGDAWEDAAWSSDPSESSSASTAAGR